LAPEHAAATLSAHSVRSHFASGFLAQDLTGPEHRGGWQV